MSSQAKWKWKKHRDKQRTTRDSRTGRESCKRTCYFVCNCM